jgi:mannose-1-phosphate guanylyltransferase
MNALILLGGLGTRLRPFTLDRPKPLLPLLNRPFIAHQLDQLKKCGVRRVVLALGYKAAHFRRVLGDGKKWGVRFVYSLEKEPLGTGGAIRNALPHLEGPALILNGDAYSDMDLGALIKFHRAKKAKGTLALYRVENPSAFGLVAVDSRGRVIRFLEKPSAEEAAAVATINAGAYFFEPEVIQRIPAGRAVSIEREVFPALLRESVALYGFLHRGYWADIGTLKTYWGTHRDLLGSRALAAPGTRIVKGAVLEGFVCLGENCVVEAGARLRDSVVLAGTRIGPGSEVVKSLVGEKCRIGAHCRVGPNQVLAGGSVLKDHSHVVAPAESW